VTTIKTHVTQGPTPHPMIKNVIAIASGKGGVGKSTVSVNLALALAETNAKVGILDADIYGPSQPFLLGTSSIAAEVLNNNRISPILAYGLQTISIGNMITENTPLIWRGPMVSRSLQQLFMLTDWDALDYLIIDLPPGTGDIHLTLSQKLPITAAVVVTTPQDLACLDARRAVEMFKKVNVHVLGVIENMASFQCPHCHQDSPLFGHHGGKKLAAKTELPLIGQIPLSAVIREEEEKGKPFFTKETDQSIKHEFRGIANTIIQEISLLPVFEKSKIPPVVKV
jgi:ATP-binding protein involved in chromosome partitioning